MAKYLVPAFYLAAMVLVVFNIWNEQNAVRKGGDGPLYRNLMECPAYIKRGFNRLDILKNPSDSEDWVRFESPPFRISNSSLPDMPKRPYLSPWGREVEEFTIIIAVEMDSRAIEFLNGSFSVLPGVFLGYIGENWEIFFNGKLIRSEVHLSDTGRIREGRSWRDVYFPLDESLIVPGTNILAMRILGDPAYDVTGLYYTAPYYLDDYRIIEKRQQNILLAVLCCISGFTGVYFLMLFLSLRRKREIFYLYYGVFSVLFCIYSVARNGLVNILIPNSDISIRLEYTALFLMVPAICIFTEIIGRGKITKISQSYLAFCLFLSLSQIFFCTQYGDDVLKIWSISILVYFSFVFFNSVVYYFLQRRPKSGKGKSSSPDTTMLHIMFGAILMYACGIFDVLDVLFFHKSFSLFIYSTFVVHFGLAITLLWRFNGMYKQLEQSNIVLETAVQERTVELEKQTEIANHASRAKSDFLAVMSHEIRTPLNAVIGLSQIELQNQKAGTSRDNITQINRSGSYLLGIINDILDISKIESENFELVPVEYEPASLIGDAVNLNRVRLASKGGADSRGGADSKGGAESKPVRFVLEIGGDFPRKLWGDELRVKQILNNLLSNAVKYTNRGTITLRVECENTHLDGTDVPVRFIVRDTGIGIRPEDAEKLFSDYTRLDLGVNRKTEGTGLGLSIAQKLTNLMGGSVTVESEYGKGSCFTAEIIQNIKDSWPIGEETAKDLRRFRYADKWQEDFVLSSIPRRKVLVVDDIPANLSVARGLLIPYGLSVDTASAGPEAIELTKIRNYDLIFIDHMMPEMDGVETAAAIKSDMKKQVPVIALTANAMRGMKEYYLEHGFEDYLSKPVNAKELDKMLVKWLGKSENSEQRAENSDQPSAHSSQLTDSSPFAVEVETQRIDMLNHYRVSFEINRDFETAYFQRFTALVKSLNTEDLPAGLREQATLLTEAGQKGDASVIRETLPAFCEALQKQQNNGRIAEDKALAGILPRLKKAILDGETKTMEYLIRETGTTNLSPSGRHLYFKINDLLLTGMPEKVVEVINNWEESHETKD